MNIKKLRLHPNFFKFNKSNIKKLKFLLYIMSFKIFTHSAFSPHTLNYNRRRWRTAHPSSPRHAHLARPPSFYWSTA